MRARISEAAFTRQVLDLARLCGWHRVHFRPGRTIRGGWSTPVQGDGAGFVDLVMVRERVLWVELKVRPNTLTPPQVEWVEWLLAAGQEVYVWYDEDWETIKQVLGYRGA